MKFIIKLAAKYLTGFLLLTAITFYVISYANFEFEIPFFNRNISNSDNSNSMLNEDNSEPEIEVATEVENLQNIVNSDDLIEKTEPNSDDIELPVEGGNTENNSSLFGSVDELTAKGFYKSDGIYSPESSSQLYEYNFAQVTLKYENLPQSKTIDTSAGKLNVIEPFMDYFLIRRPANMILCDWSGNIITDNLSYTEEALTMKALQVRNIDNKPVFSQSHLESRVEFDPQLGVEVNVNSIVQRYYIYDDSTKTFLEIDYDPVYGDRGIPFMYPSYYGADGASNISRYERNGKWGYFAHDINTEIIGPHFDMAYNFNENFAVAYLWEEKGTWRGYYNYKRLYLLNEEGGYSNNSYYAPDEATYDHLGFFYFDNGLTRAYYREFDTEGRVTVEKDVLIDTEGDEFYVPADYTIKAYSNGMILLEKDGFYGFMSYTGEWIAQPIFTYAQPFHEGLAVIGFKDGKKGLIDTKGNIIIKFQYDYISECIGGTIAIYERNQGWIVLAKMRRDVK